MFDVSYRTKCILPLRHLCKIKKFLKFSIFFSVFGLFYIMRLGKAAPSIGQ